MTIVFAIIAALALIGLGVAVMFYRRERLVHGFLTEDHQEVLLKKQALEQEIKVLRKANRDSLRVWQSERQRLWKQARDAERHAQDMQEFHLHNEKDLQHELASAYALMEILIDRVPKSVKVTIDRFEAQRIFRPIIDAFPTPRMQANPDLDMPSLDRYKHPVF